MALGGGSFTAQDAILPGTYVNFVSAANSGGYLGNRGVVAFPLELDWGEPLEMIHVTADEFERVCFNLFGYFKSDPEMLPLREIFKHAKEAYIYRLNGEDAAANTYCTAKYPGTGGNNIKTVITNSETASKFDISTYYGDVLVDKQMAASTTADLLENNWVDWKPSVTLATTAGLPCTGGTNGTVANTAYQFFLDVSQSYSFQVMGTDSTNATIKGLFSNFTKRMRDEVGIKFQCVLENYTAADHEGVISITNTADASLTYWVAGALAGCDVSKSISNTIYDGELAVEAEYTQTQLEEALEDGEFIFHWVGDEIRVLEDINTFTSFTSQKGEDFKWNQVIRVLDQIGNDIASIFNTKYLGRIPNDSGGRVSLWNDIVSYHSELQTIRAIENFSADHVEVLPGETKGSVVVTDRVTPISSMDQLYMTVIVQ